MIYPWADNFIIQAEVKDTPPDETTGTNEPVESDITELDQQDQPDTALAEDLSGISEDDSDIQAQIDSLKSQIEELQKNFKLQDEVEILKKRIDNIFVNDDTDMNDSINQTAFIKIRHIKRSMRRLANLSSEQQQLIIAELEQTPELSCQEIAAKMTSQIKAKEQDIIDFIRNTDYRFRHRHRRDSSVIDWDYLVK